MRFALGEAIRQLAAQLLHIFQAAPHEALDRDYGVQGVLRGVGANALPHLDAIGEIAHRRRQDHFAAIIGQGRCDAAAHGSDQGIRGAQVNPYRQAALVWLGTLSGLGDLQ